MIVTLIMFFKQKYSILNKKNIMHNSFTINIYALYFNKYCQILYKIYVCLFRASQVVRKEVVKKVYVDKFMMQIYEYRCQKFVFFHELTRQYRKNYNYKSQLKVGSHHGINTESKE